MSSDALTATVDPARADPARAELPQAELAQAELAQADPAQAELPQAELAQAELAQAQLAQADPAQAELARAEPPCPEGIAVGSAAGLVAGFAIGEPGRAATELGPGEPSRFPDSADYELSDSRVPGAQVRAASVRGLMHRYRGQPRQDRFSVVYDEPTSTLVVAVCDGVGQFALSQEAASFVAVDTPRAYLAHRDWHAAVDEVNERLKAFVAGTAQRSHVDAVPEDARMATTLAAVAICLDPSQRSASVAWTDDSSVWLLDGNCWQNLTVDPDEAEESGGVHTGRVKALPRATPSLSTLECVLGGEALFVMTDGVGVPLQGAAQVRETLAAWWATPPDVFTFARQVGFARRGHMDDRTVVGVWFENEPS